MIQRTKLTVAAGAMGLSAFFAAAFFLNCGCGRDVRLSGKKLREVKVKPSSHYGLTLDESATPEQVAFAGLEAIKADVTARNEAEREAALDVQFDLAAANKIVARHRTALEPAELLYNVVHQWTPTVSYYVQGFPTSWEDASLRLVRRSVGDDEAELAIAVNAPGAEPTAQVVMLIWLAKDKGLWRILHFGFDNTQRTLGRKTSGAAGDSPGHSSGSP